MGTENPRVGSSILSLGTKSKKAWPVWAGPFSSALQSRRQVLILHPRWIHGSWLGRVQLPIASVRGRWRKRPFVLPKSPAYFERGPQLSWVGRLLLYDNTLRHGNVADPGVQDEETQAIRAGVRAGSVRCCRSAAWRVRRAVRWTSQFCGPGWRSVPTGRGCRRYCR